MFLQVGSADGCPRAGVPAKLIVRGDMVQVKKLSYVTRNIFRCSAEKESEKTRLRSGDIHRFN